MLAKLFHRRYLISLSYLLVVIIGIIAWQNISLEMSPDLSLPSITVSYSLGSTSPEVMEQDLLIGNADAPINITIAVSLGCGSC